MFALFILVTMSVWADGESGVPAFPVHPVSFNGTAIAVEHAPFTAAYVKLVIRKGVPDICSGAIISHRFILTAARCLVKECSCDSFHHYILVGTENVQGGQHYEIEKTTVHQEYNRKSTDYDVGLIKLRRNLIFSCKVQSIKMADPGLVIPPEATMSAFGYGDDYTDTDQGILREIEIRKVENNICQEFHKTPITDRMICAGVYEKYTCKGDYGGPLVYNNELVGTSVGGLCCLPPSVFARISELREVIAEIMGNTTTLFSNRKHNSRA